MQRFTNRPKAQGPHRKGRMLRPGQNALLRTSASWATALVLLLGVGVTGSGCKREDALVASDVDAEALYNQNCARCHGVDGRGDANMKLAMPLADLTRPETMKSRNPEMIERVIMAGQGQMPAFGKSLSALKIQSLAGYVRRLGMGALAPSGPSKKDANGAK